MTHTKPLFAILASALQARLNCEKSGNTEWFIRHLEKIEDFCKKYLPHGSGFDSGCNFDPDASRPNRLVFSADFHHMNENGFYDGWTTHSVIITPDLAFGFNMRITGRDKREIKEYISQVFHDVLSQSVEY